MVIEYSFIIYNSYISDKRLHILGIKRLKDEPSKMFVDKLQTFFGYNIKFLRLGIAFCV